MLLLPVRRGSEAREPRKRSGGATKPIALPKHGGKRAKSCLQGLRTGKSSTRTLWIVKRKSGQVLSAFDDIACDVIEAFYRRSESGVKLPKHGGKVTAASNEKPSAAGFSLVTSLSTLSSLHTCPVPPALGASRKRCSEANHYATITSSFKCRTTVFSGANPIP